MDHFCDWSLNLSGQKVHSRSLVDLMSCWFEHLLTSCERPTNLWVWSSSFWIKASIRLTVNEMKSRWCFRVGICSMLPDAATFPALLHHKACLTYTVQVSKINSEVISKEDVFCKIVVKLKIPDFCFEIAQLFILMCVKTSSILSIFKRCYYQFNLQLSANVHIL